MVLLKSMKAGSYTVSVHDISEGGIPVYYYYELREGKKPIAHLITVTRPGKKTVSLHSLNAEPGLGKVATVKAFNVLYPRVEKDLVSRGITQWTVRTNSKMAQYLQRQHGAKTRQSQGLLTVRKTLKIRR